MRDWIDNAPKYLTVFSAAVLIISVTHEYGYFRIVGARFQSVETAHDYLTNAVLWLPVGFVAALTAIAANWFFGTFQRRENFENALATLERSPVIFLLVLLGLLSASILALVLLFNFSQSLLPPELSDIFIVPIGAGFVATIAASLIHKYDAWSKAKIIPISVAVLAITYVIGAMSAIGDFKSGVNLYSVHFEKNPHYRDNCRSNAKLGTRNSHL